MIKVKHPIEELNLKQEDLLQNIPQEYKDYYSMLFSYGNGAVLYHSFPIEPTIQDYEEWIKGLPEGNFKIDMHAKGFEFCKTILPFSRYIREKNDIGMDRFIIDKMGEELYHKYKLILDPEN